MSKQGYESSTVLDVDYVKANKDQTGGISGEERWRDWNDDNDAKIHCVIDDRADLWGLPYQGAYTRVSAGSFTTPPARRREQVTLNPSNTPTKKERKKMTPTSILVLKIDTTCYPHFQQKMVIKI